MPIVRSLETVDPMLMEKGIFKSLPSELMCAPDECVREFVSSIFEGDGSISKRGTLSLVCENLKLAEQVQLLLLRFGIRAHLLKDNNVFRLYATGEKNLVLFASLIGFRSKRKQKRLQACINAKARISKRKRWTYSEVIPNCADLLIRSMKYLKLTHEKTFNYVLMIPKGGVSRPVFERALNVLRRRIEELQELYVSIDSLAMNDLIGIRNKLGISQEDIGGSKLRSHVGYWERNKIQENRYKSLFKECCERLMSAESSVKRLEQILNSEVSFCQIKEVQKIKNEDTEWVYDVGVRPTQAFISEGAVLHNSVSVAKAGIVAKFKAKTSILAAANPKYGRFDPNELPTDQFDIEPTLLSRFDLIFAIRDILDPEKDTKLAEHILTTHKMAGLKLRGKVQEEKRFVDEELLRKFIAYARINISPILGDEAESKIKEYYIELRKVGMSQGAVPITPRQIEGLIRLSEASAKTRLSNKVELLDAERAIGLVDFVLRQISLDRQTGRLDIDIISTGQPKSKVEKTIEKHKTITEIIKDLQSKFDLVEIAKIIEAAREYNIDEPTIKKFIEDKLRQGELYEPKHGYVKIAGT
ncbi:hypothetical protein HY570_04490 [Candidatus Micrarchaeota archaeon]|nr:hypothetical protein [Candidatus Micrarchaeota archaeon]